jgi:hypothetical protein
VLPLASEPLTFCSRCGSRATPPLGPSFVYGVGSVGFQHCAVCGERWRCLWPQRRPRRGIALRAGALAGAAAIVVGAGVAAYATTRSSKPPELAAATRGAGAANGLRGPLPLPAGVRYLVIVAPSNAARTDLMQFLAGAPPVTPQSEIDRRVAVFGAVARKTDEALGRVRWPAAVAPYVTQLIAADEKLATDLARGDGLLNRSSFGQELEADALTLRTLSGQVRHALGLEAGGQLDDPRFSLL